MRTNILYLIVRNRRHNNHSLKMLKTRTMAVLMVIVTTYILMLSTTDAYPTTETVPESNVTGLTQNTSNNTRLVITHVVKTIEFEVGLLEDDGLDPDNSTDTTTPEYIETDIKLLNIGLLKELVDKASEAEKMKTPKSSQKEEASQQTGATES